MDAGELTKPMQALADDAAARGFVVVRKGNVLRLYKRRGRHGIALGVDCYLTVRGGWWMGIRSDTGNLGVCKGIWTIREVRRTLGLK